MIKTSLNTSKMIDKESLDYLSMYMNITDKIIQKIENHARRYNLNCQICAWYSDWEDFCDDWCSIGYTRTEARKLLHNGKGEFMQIPNTTNIIRFIL